LIDTVLLIGRLLLVALLYLFLFTVMKTGIGLVRGRTRRDHEWSIAVERGPKELRGVKLHIAGPVIVGRSPGADIVINATYVSGRHARFFIVGKDLMLEDLGSTNGTYVNGQQITAPIALQNGDLVAIGNVDIRISWK